jgi:putative peptidoglycan lipid II flippase
VRLWAFLFFELLAAFLADFVFGIDGLYDNILTVSVQTFLTKTQNTILSAALILSVSSGISALLGVVKNRLLASNFGVSNDLAVFYTSDYIPNLIYSVLIVGAISTVFIPIFTGALKKDKGEAFKTASSIINATLLFFVILGLIVYVFAPQIFTLLSFGKFSPTEVTLGTNLMRIMLASQLILVLGSLATSILQSQKYFLIPALAPVVYNLGMILGIVFLTPYYGIYGPAFGVLIGALLHFSVQIPILVRTGFTFTFSLNLRDRNLTKMFALIPPRILSVLVANLIQTINNSLAILISPSSVIILKFANQLQGFPVNLFGFSIAAASLPTLSAQNSKEDSTLFKKTLLTSFHQMMFLVMPLSMILFILRIPVVRLVYGVANFPWHATVETAATLAVFSVSIFSQSANYLLTRAFYALKDTVTPILIASATALLNIALSVVMVWVLKYGVWSVALAFSVTSILDTAILFYFLDRKTGGIPLAKILGPFSKISLATISMGITLYAPVKLLDQVIFDTSKTINLLVLTIIAGICGAVTYLLFTKLFKVEEIALFYKLMRKLNLTKKSINVEELTYQDQDKPQL